MAAKCFSTIHLCLIRVTRLDQIGNPVPGPNNGYVSDNPLQLGVTPQIATGDDKTLVSGCDCIIAEYKGTDKLKRFDLELDMGQMEPALQEILLGASAISIGGNVAGVWWPSQVSCADQPQPNVCFEGWQDTWEDDHQASSPDRYVHWIWPSTRWQIAAHTLANDFTQPKVTAFSRGNPNWGLGIYGDLPEAAEPLGGWFFTDSVPDAACDYISQPIS